MSERAAAITGIGAVTALGPSAAATWQALLRGECGIRLVERFDVSEHRCKLGALVADAPAERRAYRFAIAAGAEALADARLDPQAARVGLVLGTSLGGPEESLCALAADIALALGLTGPVLTISTACSSSTHAVGLARDWVCSGRADAVLAGGADELTPVLFAGFSALGVLGEAPCAPFSEPVGTTLGEGAGFVVVQAAARAARRGARVHAWIRGYGLSADAYHATSPDPTGAGVKRAIEGALGDAGLAGAAIDYVNAHGTGTAHNDAAETRAIATTLARGDRWPWISSSKSFLGHAQGAAGILELIVTLLGMRHEKLPPTMGFSAPRPRCPADPVAGSKPRAGAFCTAMSLSSAFGGANAALIVSREPPPTEAAPPIAPVLVAGAALVGPAGMTLADLDPRSLPLRGPAAEIAIERLLRGCDPRGVDRLTSLLAAAVARALAAAQIDSRALCGRIGLFVGQTGASREAQRELDDSIAERSLSRLSARAFSNLVLNAAAGAVTRMLGLRGPLTAVSTGPSSGVAIVALAADYLAHRSDADALVAAGVSDDDDAEGACAVVLARAGTGSAQARVAGWRLSTPGEDPPREWVGLTPAIDAAEMAAGTGGLAGALACALAAERAHRGASAVAFDRRGSSAVGVLFAPTEERAQER